MDPSFRWDDGSIVLLGWEMMKRRLTQPPTSHRLQIRHKPPTQARSRLYPVFNSLLDRVMENSSKNIPANAPVEAGGTRSATSPRKRNFLRPAWILASCLSIVGWLTLALFSDKTSWIDADGVLHEPLFGLIPISFFFLLVAVVLAVLDTVSRLRKRH